MGPPQRHKVIKHYDKKNTPGIVDGSFVTSKSRHID